MVILYRDRFMSGVAVELIRWVSHIDPGIAHPSFELEAFPSTTQRNLEVENT